MSEVFVIQCPEEDSEDLNDLKQNLLDTDHVSPSSETLEIIRVHPFDGQVLLQLVIPITTGTVTTAGIWIRARYDRAKTYNVKMDGVSFSGYTPSQVIKILKSRASDDDSRE